MFEKKSKLFFCLFYIISSFGGPEGVFAQNYPVQITTQLIPPFSGYIPDYATPGNQNLKLLVLFTDFTKLSYNIKLKIKISGQGINIQSKNYYYEGPFTLQPGIPIEISGNDLNGLLSNNNLDFSGISNKEYEQHKVLPEGFYNISFTAYDYNNPTQIQVSNESSAFGWMILSDPPFLNLPACGSTINAIDPQNILFQWTPMNLSSPNSAANTIYDFELFEIKPNSQSPGNIVRTLPPIYQVSSPLTFINYGITEPQLYSGMQYVWRVRARDQTNRDLFKNQGYSQICTFTYGNTLNQIDSNTLKLNLQGTALNYSLIKYTWDSLSVFTSYQLEYRKQGGANWFPVNTTEHKTLVTNLEPQNTYEARVKGILSDGEGPWSNVVTITTPAKPVIVCGQSSPPPLGNNFQPLRTGKAGQIWNVGQFDMLVTSLTVSNNPMGKYSGYGKIEIPFMLGTNLTGKFTDILVNEEMEVVNGKVEILSEGQNGGNIIDLDSVFKLIDSWFDEFDKTGDDTTLVYKIDGLKNHYCNLSSNKEPPALCSRDNTQLYIDLKTPTGPSSLRNDTKSMVSGSLVQREMIYTFLSKIKNACIKDIDLSIKDYKPSFTDFYLNDYNLKINGILYKTIAISITWHNNETEIIHPKNAIKIIQDGSSAYLDIYNRIKIKVSPTGTNTISEQLTILKVYLENLIPTKNLLLFVNGYDLLKPLTDNMVHPVDPMSYWEGLDLSFMKQIGTQNVVYANGNHSISTSNHNNIPTFTYSYNSVKNALTEKIIIPDENKKSELVDNPCYHLASCVTLDTKQNTNGFATRYENGKIAAKNMVAKIKKGELIFDSKTDIIDIVAHSMGFAYAQGMIAIFKENNFKLGNYYIIAPENAGSGNVNTKLFETVWQYGSNNNSNGDPVWLQDGVAPQQSIIGLTEKNRAYIPSDVPKGFTESHTIKNYGWIFNINDNNKGYVKKRK